MKIATIIGARPRTRKLLQETGYQPQENVKLIEPIDYFDVITVLTTRPLYGDGKAVAHCLKALLAM